MDIRIYYVLLFFNENDAFFGTNYEVTKNDAFYGDGFP